MDELNAAIEYILQFLARLQHRHIDAGLRANWRMVLASAEIGTRLIWPDRPSWHCYGGLGLPSLWRFGSQADEENQLQRARRLGAKRKRQEAGVLPRVQPARGLGRCGSISASQVIRRGQDAFLKSSPRHDRHVRLMGTAIYVCCLDIAWTVYRAASIAALRVIRTTDFCFPTRHENAIRCGHC